MNALAEFLKRENLSPAEFGRRIGRSHTTVYDWINGKKRPAGKSVDLLLRATNGTITPNDFYDLPDIAPTSEAKR